MCRRLVFVLLSFLAGLALPTVASADHEEDRLLLQDPVGKAVSAPVEPMHRLAIGINYLGGQARWNLSPKWATEFQVQTGTASSDFGDVRATVLGLRAYRFFKRRGRLSWYAGPEVAYASAETNSGSYKTSGFVAGAFGGFDYYFAKRFSLGIDIGPYVISLKEKQTSLTQTNLDFVINTQVNWHLF